MDILATLVARSQALLLALEVVLITFLAKKADDLRTSKFDDDRCIVNDGNVALGIRRAGLYLGGMIAMAGVLSGSSKGLAADLVGVLVFGVAAYAALFVARFLCDTVILAGIPDDEECLKGNVAVGIVEFGIFVATGIVLNGALAGDETSWLRGLGAFLVFFALGQMIFIVVAFVYQRLTPFNDREAIRGGNRAVAVEFAGMAVAIAIVVRGGLLGSSEGLAADVVSFLVGAVFGIVVLFLFQLVLRWVFLPGADLVAALRADNLAVALTLQAVTIAFALLLATAVI